MAIVFVILAIGVFIGAFLAFFAYVFGNIRDRWPYYEPEQKRKVIRSLILWTTCFVALGIMSAIRL